MRPRMLCTDCHVTEHPATVLDGSDRLEMLAWLFLVIPGWLYCAWRHASRSKVCGVCGGGSLVREARRAAERLEEMPSANGTTITNLNGPVLWPRVLAAPRERLRRGAGGALLSQAALVAWALVAAQPTSGGAALAAQILTVLGTAWLLHALALTIHLIVTAPVCRAWREDGSPLQIELL